MRRMYWYIDVYILMEYKLRTDVHDIYSWNPLISGTDLLMIQYSNSRTSRERG